MMPRFQKNNCVSDDSTSDWDTTSDSYTSAESKGSEKDDVTAIDESKGDEDEEQNSPEESNESGSEPSFSEDEELLSISQREPDPIPETDEDSESPISSPPASFVEPLARSSILPKATIHEQQPKHSTRLMPVPREMIQALKSDYPPPVIDLSDSDDIFIASSSDESVPKPAPVYGKTVIADSDPSVNSSAGSSKSGGNVGQKMSKNQSGSNSSGSDSSHDFNKLQKMFVEKREAHRAMQMAYNNVNLNRLKDGGKALKENLDQCRSELKELEARLLDHDKENVGKKFTVSAQPDIIFSARDQNTAHLGKKGLENHQIEKALTMDLLVNLHESLRTSPAEGAVTDPPDGLNINLMPHQLEALAWLLHRERQKPAGGILADDMGLGKTLTMISLIMKAEKSAKQEWKSSSDRHPGGTLVVCPASLVGQWQGQIAQHVKRNRLSVLVHHGNSREGRGRALTGADIVLTTYGVVAQECKTRCAIFRVAWERIILDEAHQIRNHKTQSALACCELEAKYRWCLTGTPVHNTELDIYSLLKFLRCSPFDNLMTWKHWVNNKTPAGMQRMNTVMKAILLRRTKADLKKQGFLRDLSTKQLMEIRLELDKEEREVYESVLNFSKNLFSQYLQQRAEKEGGVSANIMRLQNRLQNASDIKTHEILVLLLRLRQICSLPGLIHAMLEEDAASADGFEKEDPAVEEIYKQVRRLTISKPPEPEPEKEEIDVKKVLMTSNPVFELTRASSKMRATLKKIEEIITKTGDKIVVVSQWTNFLNTLNNHLKKYSIKTVTLDGSVPVKNRGPLVDRFNDPKSSVRVFLLSLTAGGVGLNLVGGNHLIVMEPHWNPQLESQASDRVYRVGQIKPVHIYKVICKDTIEEKIEQLQIKKVKMAENVLTGEMKKELSKLTLQDLKSLFEM